MNEEAVSKSFDLGADGFVSGVDFVLSTTDWKSALSYCVSVAALENSVFADVTAFFAEMKGEAESWNSTTYPSVVKLANGVVDYAGKVGTYYAPLDKALGQLGSEPGNATYKQNVDAIIGLLAKGPSAQAGDAGTAGDAVGSFERQAKTEEAQLRVIFEDYANLYLRGDAGGEATLPTHLTAAVTGLGAAWTRLDTQLTDLQAFADKNAKSGTKFNADISAKAAAGAWNTAGAAANTWRVNAFQS